MVFCRKIIRILFTQSRGRNQFLKKVFLDNFYFPGPRTSTSFTTSLHLIISFHSNIFPNCLTLSPKTGSQKLSSLYIFRNHLNLFIYTPREKGLKCAQDSCQNLSKFQHIPQLGFGPIKYFCGETLNLVKS